MSNPRFDTDDFQKKAKELTDVDWHLVTDKPSECKIVYGKYTIIAEHLGSYWTLKRINNETDEEESAIGPLRKPEAVLNSLHNVTPEV